MSAQNKDAPLMVDRILRLLASYSVLTCNVVDLERLYGLTPVSKYFVRDQNGVSLCPLMALVQAKVFMDSWAQLKDAVVEGGVPFDRVQRMHVFEYPGIDARFNKVFNDTMFNHTTIVINEILQVYEGFESIKQLVDVGGGLGITLKAITSKYPHIKAINFDLSHVVQHAPHYPGVEHEGGDMFESVPKGDAIFLKWILHDWSDEHCLKLLKNCYRSIPEDGKVIVVEGILAAMAETKIASKALSQLDVLLMIQAGGKERTEEEFIALATAAGFSGIRYQCFVYDFWVMEFYK
ncbi:caffeic acid 3-O-methyltransferase-like isoform X2 [Mangifera indica]|uniref:caffeic acid 3-O-methyltransferase-like isoform X2 n=1 Tax=Mangifera indica TaxID=29780 RepID=UPI001CFC0D2B|nr:caffeic acid 3-O-methyltransferase-like isoform X2 [Mangifera indica]